jgi:putative SOS response-associated peptidase YedK
MWAQEVRQIDRARRWLVQVDRGERSQATLTWYIRLKTDKPMFLAAITNYRPDQELAEGTGLAIVTAAAKARLVDVRDRRPVVLAPEDDVPAAKKSDTNVI